MDDERDHAEEPHLDGHNRVLPRVVDRVRRADDRLVTFVHEQPVVALCVAVAVGYVIGRVAAKL